MKAIKLLIKEHRERAGLDTRTLCKRAEISLATLWRIENYEVSPNLETLHKIALSLNVKIKDLIDEEASF